MVNLTQKEMVNKFMKSLCWLIAFICLIIAGITGLGVGIHALQAEWFCVTIMAVAAMFSAAEYATKYYED